MNEIKKIRMDLGKSQAEFAEALEVTQATISRLESGKVDISNDILRKLAHLLEKPSDGIANKHVLVKYQFNEKLVDLENGWNAFYVTSQDQAENSDLVLIRTLAKSSKAPFLIGDMTGHGKDSAYMAFAIKFALEAFLGLINPNAVNAELINLYIFQGIKQTKNNWKNNPSLITGTINTDKSEIELINNGMPHPLYLSSKGAKFLDQNRYPALDINSKETNFDSTKTFLRNGESIIFFSDGLLDILTEQQLLKYANNDLQYFQGDSKAIGKNIIRALKSRIDDLRDDISFLVISAKT